MDNRAVRRAMSDYQSAAASLENMAGANDFILIERSWSEFLVAANRVFTKLEQGAKSTGRSLAWWRRIKGERRKDPLINYLWHARNADEHTVEAVAEYVTGYAREIKPTQKQVDQLYEAMKNEQRAWAPLGLLEVKFPHVILLDVVDRGRSYHVPTEHLGMPIQNSHPYEVGKLMLLYLKKILDEADEMVASPTATRSS